MRLRILGSASFLILIMPLPGLAGWFEPSNYDECILESMKGVTSDKAAIYIAKSCRKKFSNVPRSRALSYEELSRLTVKGSHHGHHSKRTFSDIYSGHNFNGNIYNGNSNITVHEITIQITTTIDGKEVTRAYTVDVTVKPQTLADYSFTMTIDKDADYSWGFNSARGY